MKHKNSGKNVLYTDQVTRIYDDWVGNGYYDYPGLAEAISNVAEKNARILEIGVGTGNAAIPLAKRGFRVDGIDPSPFMLQKMQAKLTKEKIPITHYQQSVENIHLNSTYDVIFSVGGPFWVAIIEGKPHLHTYLDKKALPGVFEQLRALLKPKGRLMINIQHHGSSFKTRLGNGMDYKFSISSLPDNYIQKIHYFYQKEKLVLKQAYTMLQLSEKEVKNMLLDAGFAEPQSDTTNLFWICNKL